MKQRTRHQQILFKAVFTLFALLLLTPAVLLICLSSGATAIPLGDVLAGLFSFLGGQTTVSSSDVILFAIRLPRVLLAFLIGAGLSVCGVSMQGVFQNPMADPHLLGVSSGAALGAAVGLVFFAEAAVQTLFAFAGGLLAVFLVHLLAKVNGRVQKTRLLLSGVAITALLSSLVSALMLFNKARLDRIVHFTMGSFTTADFKGVLLMALIILPVSLIMMLFGRRLNAIALGDEEAETLGVSVPFTRFALVALSTFVTAAAVSLTGIIGFVGLVIPHTLRLLIGSDHRMLFPTSFFAGGIFLLLCDTLARTALPPLEIPVGVITAIIGGTFFLLLLHINKKRII